MEWCDFSCCVLVVHGSAWCGVIRTARVGYDAVRFGMIPCCMARWASRGRKFAPAAQSGVSRSSLPPVLSPSRPLSLNHLVATPCGTIVPTTPPPPPASAETLKRHRKRRAKAAQEARAAAKDARAEESRTARIAAMRAFTVDLQVTSRTTLLLLLLLLLLKTGKATI